MNFPEEFTVRVLDAASGKPISQIAVVLRLFAARKNDYYVGPQVTNDDGEAEFTRADCEFAIQQAKKMFLMDYEGDLRSCRDLVEVGLHAQARLARMLQQYNESPNFWGSAFRDPERLFAKLKLARNAEYQPISVTLTGAELSGHPIVYLHLLKVI